jgi:MFS family permease
MRMVLFMIAGGVLGGLLAPRLGYRPTAAAGFALAAFGLYLMSAWPAEPDEAMRWTALAVAGLGFTLADAPLYATVADAVAPERRASATAVLQVCQTMGMVVGMALLASEGLGRFDERAAALFRETVFDVDPAEYLRIIARTFEETFFAAALAMAAGVLLCMLLGDRREEDAPVA